MAKVVWGEDGEAVVAGVDELDELLDRLAREAESGDPFVVELVADDGATLSMGLGRPLSVVDYVSASLDPPYFQSVGQDGHDEPLVFYYRGEWSEFAPESAIPTEQARAALRRFIESQSLPDNINWEET
jgi:hypothetical protein